MAVFYTNTCKFSGCSLTFASLGQLIEHIEETHIDSDPQFIAEQEGQQPSAVALSYVIKFVTDAAKHHETQPVVKKRPKPSLPVIASVRSITPSTGSEYEEFDDSGSESDSDNSWTMQDQEYTSDIILRKMNPQIGDDKPYLCPVPGCKKRYKNVNGIKYHAKNGHRKENKVKKSYKCRCGKSYKSAQGLRQHASIRHPPTTLITTNALPKTHQSLTAVASCNTTTVVTPTHRAGNQLGLTLQNRNLLVEPVKTTVGMSTTVVEPGTPLTPLTPTTPSTGFTLVTLPSPLDTAVLAAHKLDGTVVSVQQIQPDGSTVSIMR